MHAVGNSRFAKQIILFLEMDLFGLGIGFFASGLFFDEVVDGLGRFWRRAAWRRLVRLFLKQAKNRPYQMHDTKAEGEKYEQPKNP